MALNVKFLKGTSASYNALLTKDANTFYYVDGANLYLGDILLSNSDEVAAAVARIDASDANIAKLQKDLADLTGDGEGSVSEQIDALNAALTAKIDANAKAIADETTRATTAESTLRDDLDGAIARITTSEGNISTLQGEMDAVEAAISTLNGADEGSSVREIAMDALTRALIPDTAQEALDTLEEIADWIQQHPEDASAMNTAITNLQGDVEAINNVDTGILAQAKAYTDEEIAKINDEDTGILAEAKTYTDSAASTTYNNAVAYVDGALSWGEI